MPDDLPQSFELVRYDAMCRAIAEAHAVDEVKTVRDKARAIEMYARQAQNTEAERQAIQIRLRAERRCGELTAQLMTAQGTRTDLTSYSDDTKLAALHKAGISKVQASQWERLAAIPADDFDADLTDPAWRPTTSGLLEREEAREQKRTPKTQSEWTPEQPERQDRGEQGLCDDVDTDAIDPTADDDDGTEILPDRAPIPNDERWEETMREWIDYRRDTVIPLQTLIDRFVETIPSHDASRRWHFDFEEFGSPYQMRCYALLVSLRSLQLKSNPPLARNLNRTSIETTFTVLPRRRSW